MKPLIVWGGGGQLIVLSEFVNDLGYEIVAVIDSDTNIKSPLENVPIFYKEFGLKNFLDDFGSCSLEYVVAIGGGKGHVRCKISKLLMEYGLKPINAIHPESLISKTSKIGSGCQIMMRAIVGARAIIGDNVLLNSGSIVEHECHICDGVHIGPGATLAGMVSVGKASFIGAGATILPRITIGENSVVGAGSVVTKDIPDNVVCTGVPAKIFKKEY